MSRIIEDAYNYELVDTTPSNVKYDFVSVGTKEVPKRVSITHFDQPELSRYYNLGFSNFQVDETGKETVSDMSRDNNRGDADRVLNTVMACALDFLSKNSDSILTFFGNTAAKHRYYKMQICRNFDKLEEFLIVKGGIIENLQFTETVDGKDFGDGINLDFDSITYEEYNTTKSSWYSFITVELKQEYRN